jgi:hypothetical protein
MDIKRNHYDVLGVGRRATIEEIRRAYRSRARESHPDLGVNMKSSQSMTDINLAWTVLSDERKRREYDALVLVADVSPSADTAEQTAVRYPIRPMRFPWRAMLIASALGAVLVLVLHSFSEPAPPGAPDQLLSSGSCVNIGLQLDVYEVTCAGPHDAVVEQLIGTDRICPIGTEPFRDRQGMGKACVIRTAL